MKKEYEIKVMCLIALGYSNFFISRRLGILEEEVEKVRNI
jgi:DNA-binding CsgD family transcriptional regulator